MVEANFIVQHRVTTQVVPPGAGSVTIRPGSPDGFYTQGTPISVASEPSPGSEYRFESWSPRWWWGRSEKPIPPSHVFRVRGPGFCTARFYEGPLFLIDSNVERIDVYLDGERMRTPAAVRPRNDRPVIRYAGGTCLAQFGPPFPWFHRFLLFDNHWHNMLRLSCQGERGSCRHVMSL